MLVREVDVVKIILLKMFGKQILDERTLSTALIANEKEHELIAEDSVKSIPMRYH